MPVSDNERDTIKKMDKPARDTFLAEQLKAIREASTGPAVNHVAVNDALDRLAVMLEPKVETKAKTDPAPGATFKPGQMDTPPVPSIVPDKQPEA